jgi:hypothetical protein
MLKPIDPNPFPRQPREPLPPEVVNNVFKVLHGFYGNLFLSKFATGDVDPQSGEDRGLASARNVWGHGLREFDASTIKTALGRCIERHTEYPPNLPQFTQLCMACKVREVYKLPEQPAIGISDELRAEIIAAQRQKARELAEEIRAAQAPKELDALKQAIASAVAAAGGDEAMELLRLDRMLAPRART